MMDLDELRSVQSRERQTDSLQQLRGSFYRDVGEFVEGLREKREHVAERADDPWNDPEISRLSDDIETAEDTAEAIYERRVGKIVKMASLAAADMPIDDDGLTAEERQLFEALVDEIEDSRDRVEAILDGESSPDAGPTRSDDAAAPDGESAGREPVTEGEAVTDQEPPGRDGTVGGPEAANTEARNTETPDTETPDTETPDTETPDTETPDVDAADLMGAGSDSRADTATATGSERVSGSDGIPETDADRSRDTGPEQHPDTGPTPSPDTDPETGTGPGSTPDGNTDRAGSADSPEREPEGTPPTGGSPGGGERTGGPSGRTPREAGSTDRAEPTDTDGAESAPTDPDVGTEPASRESPDQTGEAPASADPDRSTVRITADVGEILGIEGRSYDLSASDVVTLPEANAEPLVERDAAERLD